MAENLISRNVVLAVVGSGAKTEIVDAFVNAVNKYGTRFGLINPESVAMFLAQCAHESGGFKWMGESGWLKNPDAANKSKAYYPYYGRGFIQVTWKDAYTKFSQWYYGDNRAVTNPKLLENPTIGAIASLWWWGVYKPNDGFKDLHTAAQKGDITRVTKIVNGGTKGLAERKKYFNTAIAVFKKKIWNVLWAGASASVSLPLHGFLSRIYLYYKK